MRRLVIIIAAALMLGASAGSAAAAPVPPVQAGTFIAVLRGANEQPTVMTRALGLAVFNLNADGTELSYAVFVANIDNVTMAHIHLGSLTTPNNGPIVAWLYPSAPPAVLKPGITFGILASGTITQANLVGPLTGQPLSALVDDFMMNDAYVQVHTLAYPAGEIRGEITPVAP